MRLHLATEDVSSKVAWRATFAASITGNLNMTPAGRFVLGQLACAAVGAAPLLGVLPDASDTSLGTHVLGEAVSNSMGSLV